MQSFLNGCFLFSIFTVRLQCLVYCYIIHIYFHLIMAENIQKLSKSGHFLTSIFSFQLQCLVYFYMIQLYWNLIMAENIQKLSKYSHFLTDVFISYFTSAPVIVFSEFLYDSALLKYNNLLKMSKKIQNTVICYPFF